MSRSALVRVPVPYFTGGVNQSRPASEIEDNELAEASNYELTPGGKLRVRPGTVQLNSTTVSSSRFSSMWNYLPTDGSSSLLLTAGTSIYLTSSVADTLTDITDVLVLPDDAQWDWTTFNDWAIGCNGSITGSGETAVVKVISASSTAAAALATAPPMKYITSFNNRIFGVLSDSPNTVQCCALNAPEDWATTGAAGTQSWIVGNDAGGTINGISEFLGVLFVFMRRKIYMIIPDPSDSRDVTLYQVKQLSNELGTFARWSIKEVLGTLVFLSDEGVGSIESTNNYGDFTVDVISRNVPDLQLLNKSVTSHSAAVDPVSMQYLLAVAEDGQTRHNRVWVLDYRRASESGQLAWFPWDGEVSGSVLQQVIHNSVPRIYIAGYKDELSSPYMAGTTTCTILRLRDDDVWTDNGAVYPRSFRSKAYRLAEPAVRSEYTRFSVQLEALTATVTFTLQYRLDETDDRQHVTQHSFAGLASGDKWGEFLWDAGLWFSGFSGRAILQRRVAGSQGRRGISFQFQVLSETDEAFEVRAITLEGRSLTPQHTNNL